MANAEVISPPQPVILHNSDEQNGSLEDLAALMQNPQEAPEPTELEKALAGGLEEVAIPVTLTLDDGRVFHADEVQSWGWTPFGVYAQGRYDGEADDVEKNVLFAGRKISSIELHVEAYKAFVETVNELESEKDEAEDAPAGD